MSSRISPLVIVANRLPVSRARGKAGSYWKRSPGGLVSALTPIVQRAGGAWIGWTGTVGSEDKPFTLEKVDHVPVSLTRSQFQDFYHGFCNETIWPLYHHAVRVPAFHRHWWRPYVTVNKKYAQVTSATAGKGATVWIHDYHLQLVPALLRELRPDLRIGFFLHIPFPPEELFGQLPWRRQILEGILGADLVGFQTQRDVDNFIRLCRRHADARFERKRIRIHGREIRVEAFPISIDFERYAAEAAEPAVIERSLQLKQQVGKGRQIVLGVDRLDYTKGIDVRLYAFHDLLSRHREIVRQCVFVQLAVPSRERVGRYRELRREVEGLVGQVNGEFGEVGLTPMQYLHRDLPFNELIAMYRAADVMLVTPLADGMNLVAKEYVATRLDDSGILILSEFAGAAQELQTALQVNPYDVDGLAETIKMALSLPSREIARRMRRMREVVSANTVYDWADSFLKALSGRTRQ